MTIYFDNAATTWPKPPSVIRVMADTMQNRGGNPGRGSHKLSGAATEILYDCRELASDFFGASPENVVFTLNATHALNLAIKGLARDGAHILIDNFAHNAAYRPVMALRNRGCIPEVYDASGSAEETLENLRNQLRPNTGMIIATHHSNVCSKILPIAEIGAFCAKFGILFVVDASQSAGNLPIDLRQMQITALCMPGHKGLYGPMGCGMLLTAPDVQYSTLIEGGAGIRSLDVDMPDELPERLEAGTVALPAIAGLHAGMEWVKRKGIDNIRRQEEELAAYFNRYAQNIRGLQLKGDTNGSVVSFTLNGISTAEIGEKLNRRGICTRTGYHCSPLAHKTLGTLENGTVRLGFSYFNRFSEIDRLLNALEQDFS